MLGQGADRGRGGFVGFRQGVGRPRRGGGSWPGPLDLGRGPGPGPGPGSTAPGPGPGPGPGLAGPWAIRGSRGHARGPRVRAWATLGRGGVLGGLGRDVRGGARAVRGMGAGGARAWQGPGAWAWGYLGAWGLAFVRPGACMAAALERGGLFGSFSMHGGAWGAPRAWAFVACGRPEGPRGGGRGLVGGL